MKSSILLFCQRNGAFMMENGKYIAIVFFLNRCHNGCANLVVFSHQFILVELEIWWCFFSWFPLFSCMKKKLSWLVKEKSPPGCRNLLVFPHDFYCFMHEISGIFPWFSIFPCDMKRRLNFDCLIKKKLLKIWTHMSSVTAKPYLILHISFKAFKTCAKKVVANRQQNHCSGL